MRPKKILLTLICAAGILGAGTAQHNPLAMEYIQAGEISLLEKNYKKAMRQFKTALSLQDTLMAAERGMGLCYEMLKDYPNALQHYLKIIEVSPRFSRALYYQIGEVYFKMGLPAKAIAYFEQFRKLQFLEELQFTVNGEKERLLEDSFLEKYEASIRACQVSMDTSKFRQNIRLVNLGSNINTRSDEYFPFLSNNQSTIFFTRRRNTERDENLFISTSPRPGQWTSAGPVSGPINTSFNEGMCTMVRDGRHMYFTACNRPEIEGPCDIWEATVEKNQVRDIHALSGHPNSPQWESQAAISCDGKQLYFASNRPGGSGGTDIWLSERLPDGSWTEPQNLGEPINTLLDEEAPFISNDGNALYFSSTGHLGMGDQDIFVSFRNEKKQWSPPINLGPLINSPHRELGFFLSADNKTAYFASDRPEGFGGMDIYRADLQEALFSEPTTFTEFFFSDSLTGLPVMAKVAFDNRPAVQTDSNGHFFLCLPANSKLNLQITAPGYHPYVSKLPIPQWDNRTFYVVEYKLRPIRSPQPSAAVPPPDEPAPAPTRLKTLQRYSLTLFYQLDSDLLEPNERDKLNLFLAEHAGKTIKRVEVNGFADDIGQAGYNLALSERRAKGIAIILMEKGFPTNSIAMKGYGEIRDGQPKAQNRRVELKITVLE
jgi:outer membrane protein OmpA-like peptidoglycan-associated protein/tetratricopeptide (TPR) repeat protein